MGNSIFGTPEVDNDRLEGSRVLFDRIRLEWWDCSSAWGSLFATDVIRVLAMAQRDQIEGGVGGNRNGQDEEIRVTH